MSYTPSQIKFLNGIASQSLWKMPQARDHRQNYYDEQEEQLRWSIDQAVSRGMIDPTEAQEAKDNNERTWWDRAWGFKDSSRQRLGAVAQPLIDTLSLGNYAVVAATQATLEDPLVNTGSLKLGFTPSAWYKQFKDRPYYSEMLDNFWVGLGLDIALDPITYLTFGVGPGVKVGTQGVVKIGTKMLPKGTQKLTLTRYGTRIYNLAAQEMRPIVEKAIAAESEKAVAAGGAKLRLIEGQTLTRYHDEIAKHMVNNYDKLAFKLADESNKWTKFKSAMVSPIEQGGDALINTLRQGIPTPHMGKTVEDLFQETARRGHKEIGVHWGQLGKKIGRSALVGPIFKAVAPNFHRKLGVPQDVRDVWALTKNTMERQTKENIAALKEGLGDLSPAQLRLITDIIETGDEGVSRLFDEGQQRMLNVLAKDGTYIDDEVMRGVDFAKAKFAEIATRENAAGFKVETVRDYVMRVYKTRDARTVIMNHIKGNQGVSNFAIDSSFQMHRMIATMEEAMDVMGQGMVETNIGTILARREAASVRMIEMEKFYDYIKATSGISNLMIYQAGNEGKRIVSVIKKILKMQRPQENKLYDYDQVLSMPEALHARLGFSTDEAYKFGGADRNLKLLDYLSLSITDRAGIAGNKLSQLLRPNPQAEAGRQVARKMKLKGREYDVVELLKMEYGRDIMSGMDDAFSLLYGAVATHAGVNVTKITAADIGAFLKGMDRHFRAQLDTPLLYMFPDILERVTQVAAKGQKLGKRAKGGTRVLRDPVGRKFKKIEKMLKRPVSTYGSFVPQLPEEFVLRAKIIRMRLSDFSDLAATSEFHIKEIGRLSAKIGLKEKNLTDIMHALVGKRAISELTDREAGKLVEFMGIHAGEFTKRNGVVSGHLFSTGVRKVTFGQTAKPFFDEMNPLVRESIENAERMALDETRRLARQNRLGRGIDALRKQAGKLKESLKIAERNLLKGQEQLGFVEKLEGFTPEEIAKFSDAELAEAQFDLTSKALPKIVSSIEDLVLKAVGEEGLVFSKIEKLFYDLNRKLNVEKGLDNVDISIVSSRADNLVGYIKDINKVLTRSPEEIFNVIKSDEIGELAAEFTVKDFSKKLPAEVMNAALKIIKDKTGSLHTFNKYTGSRVAQGIVYGRVFYENMLDASKKAIEFSNKTAGFPFYGAGVANLGKLTKQVAHLTKEIAKRETEMSKISKLRNQIQNPINQPKVMTDKRPYVSSAETLQRNADVMDDAELEMITRLKGVARETRKIGSVLTAKDMAPAKAVRAELAKTIKPIQRMIDRTTKAIDAATTPEAIAQLTKTISFLEDSMAKAIDEAANKFSSNGFKILDGGRYMDDTGKVRDLLIRQSGKKHIIMGKHRAKIKEALIADTIRKGRGNIQFLRPATIKELPDTVLGTAGGSYWLPEDIARFLQDVVTPLYEGANPMIDGLLKGFDRIQNIFKVPLLAPWFSTTARNGIGNVSIAYMKAGLALADPDHLSDFMKILIYTWGQESPTFRKAFMKASSEEKLAHLGKQTVRYLGSKEGTPMTIAELSQEMGKRGVFTSWMRDEVFDVAPLFKGSDRVMGGVAGASIGASSFGPVGALLGAGVGALLGKESYRMNHLFRFQELASELPTRMMLGLHAFKETGSVDEAGRVVRHFLHDYSELSTFERRFVRRMIPFYNFTKMAFRVVGTQVIENPGRVILPQKIFTAQNLTGAGFDERAMPEDVPDWFHRQMVFMGKDIDEETGTMKTWVYGGMNLPVQEVLQLTDIIAPGGQPITRLGSRASFAATSALEYVMNYDTFRGGPIYPNVDAGIKQTLWESGRPFKGSPDWMKKLVGYEVGDDDVPRVNPRMAWLLGEVPTSRFLSVSKKIWELDDEGVKDVNYRHLSGTILGLTQYRYDPETQQYFRNKAKVDAMTAVLSNIRVLKSYSIDRSTFEKVKHTRNLPPALAGDGPITMEIK